MTKHSPGPWNPMRSGDGKHTAFFAANDNRICEPVFVVEHDDITEEGAKVVDANMKLLKHAPELLEALNELLSSYMTQMPPAEAGKEAQDAWADRRSKARTNAALLIDRLS